MKLSDKIFFVILLIIIVTVIYIKIFSSRSELILLDYASFKSTNMISSIINNSINDVLLENTYDNIITESKDKTGNIVNINFDNLIVNRLLYQITDNLLNNQSLKYKDKSFFVPLGVIYNIPVLNNMGPKIPFRLEFIKGINSEAKINIKEYGINSSMVELIININIQMEVIMPFKSKAVSIDKNVILDSKIVQGKVPDYYGGLISGSLK